MLARNVFIDNEDLAQFKAIQEKVNALPHDPTEMRKIAQEVKDSLQERGWGQPPSHELLHRPTGR